MKVIDFYFDFASPYGYIAATQINTIANNLQVKVIWHPILLGIIFKKTGMSATSLQPLRKEYFFHDIQRLGRLYGIPLQVPSVSPINALLPSRTYYWINQTSTENAQNFSLQLFNLYWQHDKDIGKIEHITTVTKNLGLSEQDVIQGSQSNTVREQLRHETNLAIEKGVFGSPFFLYNNEPFWGSDRLNQLKLWIEKGGW